MSEQAIQPINQEGVLPSATAEELVMEYFTEISNANTDDMLVFEALCDNFLYAGAYVTPTYELNDALFAMERLMLANPMSTDWRAVFDRVRMAQYGAVKAVLAGLVVGDAVSVARIPALVTAGVETIAITEHRQRIPGRLRRDLWLQFDNLANTANPNQQLRARMALHSLPQSRFQIFSTDLLDSLSTGSMHRLANW